MGEYSALVIAISGAYEELIARIGRQAAADQLAHNGVSPRIHGRCGQHVATRPPPTRRPVHTDRAPFRARRQNRDDPPPRDPCYNERISRPPQERIAR